MKDWGLLAICQYYPNGILEPACSSSVPVWEREPALSFLSQYELYLRVRNLSDGQEGGRFWSVGGDAPFKPEQVDPTAVFVSGVVLDAHPLKPKTLVQPLAGRVGTGHQTVDRSYSLQAQQFD